MKGNVSFKLKKGFAGGLATVLTIAMAVPGSVAFAAGTDMACHIGDNYYLSLEEAVGAAKDGDTIVIDKADAGTLSEAIDMIVTIDAGSTGYDLKTIEAADGYCKEVNGTSANFAEHLAPAKDGGVIFNWDMSDVSKTTVTIKDENGHTTDPAAATVNTEGAADCETAADVTYTATYTYNEQEYTDTKTVHQDAKGHTISIDDETNVWDGKTYDKDGVPAVKVTVSCKNGDVQKKEATVKLEKQETVKAPTCSATGTITYYFSVSYDGKQVKTSRKDGYLVVTDQSAPATGNHVKDNSVAPTLEFKTYSMNADGKFLDAKGKVVSSKDAAEVIWTGDQSDEAVAKAFELDGVLTYRLAWTCKECGVAGEFKDAEQTSAGTAKYFRSSGKAQKAKTNCTAYSVNSFAPVNYTTVKDGKTTVNELKIDDVTVDYEPTHGTIDTTKTGYEKVAPTHTEKGSEKGVCSDCGEMIERELAVTPEHTYAKNAKDVTLDADCTHKGVTYKVCTVCEEAGIGEVTADYNVGDTALEGTNSKGVAAIAGSVIVSEKDALGHNYVVLNADKDAKWNTDDEKDIQCDVTYQCARCREEVHTIFHSAAKPETGALEGHEYSAITATTTKGADCTKTDVITYTVNNVKDYNTGKAISTDVATDVIGLHKYAVKTVNFSKDGKSVNVTLECSVKGCKTKTKTIAATSTASEVGEDGITVYTASITEANLKAAKLDPKEVDTTIPADKATMKVYDLSNATVETKDYDYDTEYSKASKKDIVVKIGNVTIDPKYYNDPVFEDLDGKKVGATVTVDASNYSKNGISAAGTAKGTYDVTEDYTPAKDELAITINGKAIKNVKAADLETTYDGSTKSVVVTSKKEGAKITYTVNKDGKDLEAADKAEFKDAGKYTVTFHVRNTDATTYEETVALADGTDTIVINPAKVTIQDEYTKTYGEADPALVVSGVVEGEDLAVAWGSHRNDAGWWNVELLYDKEVAKNYNLSTTDVSLNIQKRNAGIIIDDATKTVGEADPEFTWTETNVIEGDDLGVVVKRAKGKNNEKAGTYALTATANNTNYNVKVTDGTLTIEEEITNEPVDPVDDIITGWYLDEENDDWYLYSEEGEMLTGWQKVNGLWYFMDEMTGIMQRGWFKDGGNWYYLSGSGAMYTGWLYWNNDWYFLKGDGAMAIGWAKLDGKWYYLKESGAMATGWFKDGRTWYFLQDSGAMATGWLKDGNNWYYLKASGAMATGWAYVNNNWYYLKDNGAMATGWVNVNGTWYYLNADGAMAANTWVGNYYVDNSGAWTATR